jgi:FtsP/CotA-like multicopper oxidase with cupredoxin domain
MTNVTGLYVFLVPSVLAACFSPCFGQSQDSPFPRVRNYFIAAEEVSWDYTPNGRNQAGIPHMEGAEDESASPTAHRIYPKAVLREYADATFQTRKERPPDWEHLGILGPLIRAEVGDNIRVVFKNNTKLTCSLHPHGLAYAKDSEGAMYSDGTPAVAKNDDLVPPGSTYTYSWRVTEQAGPGPAEGSSVLWMYHGHVVESKDMNTGLLGPIIVTARGSALPDGTPKDVDREFVAAFAVFDETDSWYFDAVAAKIERVPNIPLRASDPVFREMNLLASINGLVEGNLPMLTMKRGERVRWYLFANGNEDDVHTVHWHGQTVLSHHMRTDTVSLAPMGMSVADMVPESEGAWLLHCHVNDHMNGGMQALFQVLP